MAIIKIQLEAVRYIAAKAVYENDELCKSIISSTTYGRRGVGFNNLIDFPYHRDANSPRACNVIADTISKKLGDDWYKLLVDNDGIQYIRGVLRNENTIQIDLTLASYNLTDEDLLYFFKEQEVLLQTN